MLYGEVMERLIRHSCHTFLIVTTYQTIHFFHLLGFHCLQLNRTAEIQEETHGRERDREGLVDDPGSTGLWHGCPSHLHNGAPRCHAFLNFDAVGFGFSGESFQDGWIRQHWSLCLIYKDGSLKAPCDDILQFCFISYDLSLLMLWNYTVCGITLLPLLMLGKRICLLYL